MTHIIGEISEEGIAGSFREHFRNVYSGSDSPGHEALKSDFFTKFHAYFDNHKNDSLSPMYFSWSNMLDILARIKTGKSSSGLIRPEHVLHGSMKLPLHLHLLYNSMIQHGFVLSDFVLGTITPIVKDSNGDKSDCAN